MQGSSYQPLTSAALTARRETAAGPQSARLARINHALEALWRRKVADRPDLDPESMIAAARRRTGLADLGDPDVWQTQLQHLCDDLHRDARLSPLGRTIAQGQLVAILRDRLLAHALWKRLPVIAEVPVSAPIIVVGQMRSGTTRMQRLLACDPTLDSTRFFESWNPIPLRRSNRIIDDRRWRARAALNVIRLLNPRFGDIHPTAVDAPDEEIGFNSFSLFGSAFEAQWRVPGFARHCEERDRLPIYREFRFLLQTVKYLRGRGVDRPWVIKLPQMTQDLETVLRIFPDARLVVLNRSATAVVGSSASLVENQMRIQSDAVDRHWIGREWLRKTALRDQRTRAALEQFGGPMIELDYERVGRNMLTSMRDAYRHLGLVWTAAAEDAMARYQTKTSASGARRHCYGLDRYGLTGCDVAKAISAHP